MKIFSTLTVLLLVQPGLQAQKEGSITYVQKTKMDIQLDSATRAMLGDLPDEATVKKLLLFNENTSLYMNAPGQENKKTVEEAEGRRIEIKTDSPDEKIYTDFKNNRVTEQRDFMGKKFLIDTALTKAEWKITGKQKSILGYPCQQAVKTGKTDTVYAWFTPAIQVSTGPEGAWGLPGLILELEMHHGQVQVMAEKAELTAPARDQFVKPKEGKKVTPHTFKTIVDKKTKEMQEQFGGSGNMIIQIERR